MGVRFQEPPTIGEFRKVETLYLFHYLPVICFICVIICVLMYRFIRFLLDIFILRLENDGNLKIVLYRRIPWYNHINFLFLNTQYCEANTSESRYSEESLYMYVFFLCVGKLAWRMLPLPNSIYDGIGWGRLLCDSNSIHNRVHTQTLIRLI